MVLAAGAGTRLRPLTDLTPKPLCPVDDEPLLHRAVAQARTVAARVVVNAHHTRLAVAEAAAELSVDVVVEHGPLLGTAGGVANAVASAPDLPFVVVNGDAWRSGDAGGLDRLLDGWDGDRVRLLVVDDEARADFDGRWRFAGASLLPAADAARLEVAPSGLYEVLWRPARDQGRVDLVPFDGAYFDCGTPSEYLAANLHASGGVSVVGEGAVVEGELVDSVVWPGAHVTAGERLVRTIRAGDAERPVTVVVEDDR